MRVIVATDGSKQSLAAAQALKAIADPANITEVVVTAVLSPFAVVPFVNELSGPRKSSKEFASLSFRDEATEATGVVMSEFEGWGPKVSRRLRSGSPAAEIVKLADSVEAGLIVVASGGRGLSDTVLLGSTASKVQHSAHCPVLVTRGGSARRRKG